MNKKKALKKKNVKQAIEKPNVLSLPLSNIQNEALPVLAAGLAHEVKNPLSAIHLHLQLLENQIQLVENPSLREAMLKRVEIIKKEILSLNRLLQEFIKIIRAEKRNFTLLELNELIPSIVSLLKPQADKVQASIYFYPGRLPAHFEIDPLFVKQILINLIINSIQAFYTDKDATKKRKIEISTGIENELPYIRVADNGPGIPSSIQGRIFEPFFTTKQDGSGLGLALVKKMVEEMGGEIDFVSKEGEGTVFTIYFYGNSMKNIGQKFPYEKEAQKNPTTH
ncbi:MAG: ATP-binding protein [Leptospiraceae bacterium]|nr:ATP-binding protein [Leptospiraceae bacterium]MDW7976985.1 ATP-binding protein [Leptospiraceae bacterium]